MQQDKRIPVTIISGFLGSGKTTLLRHCLAHKPAGARWAVLVNEFGVLGIDEALLGDADALAQVAGGCICCTTALLLRTNLNRLIRQRPDHLLIEPSGLGHLQGIVALLQEPDLAQWLCISQVWVLVDMSQIENPVYRHHPLFLDQLKSATGLIASKIDCIGQGAAQTQLMQLCADEALPQKEIAWMQWGQLPVGQVVSSVASPVMPAPVFMQTKAPAATAKTPKPDAQWGVWRVWIHVQQGYASISAACDVPRVQSAVFLQRLCALKPLGIMRMKAAVHTLEGWKILNHTVGQEACQPSKPLNAQRIEWIVTEALLAATLLDIQRVLEADSA